MDRTIVTSKKHRFTVNADMLASFSFVSFFCVDFLKASLRMVFGAIGLSSLVVPVCLIWIYFPLILLCIYKPRSIVPDFIALLAFLGLFFLTTLLFHPDYANWYAKDTYGAWDYVFRPDNGLYAYLFLRLIDNPKRLLKLLRISAFIMIAYQGCRLIPFLQTGYWTTSNQDGSIHYASYSLKFGYDVLLWALVFLYFAFDGKRRIDWIMAVLSIVYIVLGGSRGPFLCIIFFVAVYALVFNKSKKQKLVFAVLLFSAGTVLFVAYEQILQGLAELLDQFGLRSRIISRLIAGTVSDDNGRIVLWNATLDMIKENPFGYGAMGTRHVLDALIWAGYPHNFILELIADFGIFIGGGLVVFFAWRSVSILRMQDIREWRGLFLIFLGVFFQLMLSSTYYHRMGFWSALAVGVSIYRERRVNHKKVSYDQVP